MRKCQYISEDCQKEATLRVTAQWGGSRENIDTFYLCRQHAKEKEKECQDWAYVYREYPLEKVKNG